MSTLPANPLTLEKTSQLEDSSSYSIVHNLNAKTLEDYVNAIRSYVESIDIQPNVTISQETFNALLDNAKNRVILLVSMVNGDYIDFNDYRITKIGTFADAGPNSIEFRITDLNVERATNFRNAVCIVRTYAGQTVYPIIKTSINQLSIVFSDKTDIEPTTVTPETDPNNKRIILF